MNKYFFKHQLLIFYYNKDAYEHLDYQIITYY